jgi:hypothetical protein
VLDQQRAGVATMIELNAMHELSISRYYIEAKGHHPEICLRLIWEYIAD